MRQQIDCAVLVLAAHQSWVPLMLKALEPGLNRVRLHFLEWEAGHHLDLKFTDANTSTVSLPVETLAQASLGLRRYDVVLLPVAMETLAWTRQALAAIPRGPFVPLMGILNDIRSAAIQDLLEMGMSDFVRLPICSNEFRARLLHTVTAVPRPGSLREPSLNYGQSIAIARGVLPLLGAEELKDWLALTKTKTHTKTRLSEDQLSNVLAGLLPSGPDSVEADRGGEESENEYGSGNGLGSGLGSGEKSPKETEGGEAFNKRQRQSEKLFKQKDKENIFEQGHLKTVKAKLVEELERSYITEALRKNKGNIAIAARYSGKHRRAFWALMRKYKINAKDYRR